MSSEGSETNHQIKSINHIRRKVLNPLFHSHLHIFLFPDLTSLTAHVLLVVEEKLPSKINYTLGNESPLLKVESSAFETSYFER